MSAKYTQDGPWVDSGLTGVDPRITGGPLRLIKSNGVVVAFLPCWLDDEAEEARANASLIAAAPELLAFAQQFLDDYSSEDGMYSLKHYARKAQELIAKATGAAS